MLYCFTKTLRLRSQQLLSQVSRHKQKASQEAQLSQEGCATVAVVKTLKRCLGVTQCHRKTVPFARDGTVSYSYFIATMTVSLAVSTQYINVTDTQPDIQTPHNTSRTMQPH